jgi:hypothetical protein
MSTEKSSVGSEDSAPTPEPVVAESAGGQPLDEFDPAGWTVPVICKDCDKEFTLPYRVFLVGVVFHCPHCRGSFVPTVPMYRAVRDAFDTFYARRRSERDKSARDGGGAASLARKQATEREEFVKTLDKLARTMRPAGKMVRWRGIRAMFT